MSYDDEFYDDDDYFDDEEDDLDDDEQIGFDRSSVNPFRTGGSSESSGSSGLPGRSRFGGSGSGGSLSSRLSSDAGDEDKRKTGEFESERERLFGSRGSSGGGGSAASRFSGRPIGSRRADDDDEGDEDDESGRSKSPFTGSSSSGSRFSGRPIGSRRADDDSKDDDDSRPKSPTPSSTSSGSRFGGGGSPSSGSRFGGGSSSSSGSRFGGGSSSSSSGSRFGGGSSSEKDDDKGKSPSGSGSRFGGGSSSSSSGSRFGGGSSSDRDKDNRSGSRLGNRFGGNAKKDDKGGDSRGKSRSGDSGSSGGRLGGLTSRFGGGKKDDSKKPAAASDKSGDGGIAAAAGGLVSGIGSRFGLGGNAKKDDKGGDSRGKSRSGDSGSSGGRLGGLTSRFGGGKKDDKGGQSGSDSGSGRGSSFNRQRDSQGDGKSGGRQSPFGREKGNRGKKQDDSAQGGKTAAAAATSGGFLSGLTSRLPFGGGGDTTKKSQRTSKTRASKIPTAKQDGGLSLDDKLDILGVGLIIAAFIMFLSSLSGEQGALTGAINGVFTYLLGWGAVAVPVILLAIGFWLIVRHFGEEPPEVDPVRVTGLVVLYLTGLSIAMFVETFSPLYSGVTTVNELVLFLDFSIEAGRGGGLIGAELYTFLVSNATEAGAVVAMIGLAIIGIMLTTRTTAGELAVLVISLWRGLQVTVQQRAQKQRALRLEAQQRKAEEQARISVSKPAPAELSAGATNALPEPAMEDRAIPIRMGGQMVTANIDETGQSVAQPQPVMQGVQTAAQTASEPKSRGFVGDFAVRLLSAVPGIGNGNDDEEEQTTPQSAAQPQPIAQATPAAQPATFGSLLGQSKTQNGQPSDTTPAPAGVPNGGTTGHANNEVIERPAVRTNEQPTPGQQPAAERTVSPAASPFSAPASGSQPTREKPPQSPQTQQPAAAFTTPERVQEKPETSADRPKPAFTGGSRFGSSGGSAGQPPASTPDQKTGDAPASTTGDGNVLSNRLSRLDAIRQGNTARPASDLRGSLLDDDDLDADDEDETQLAEPANGTPTSQSTEAPEDLLTSAPAEKASGGPLRPTPFTPSSSNTQAAKPTAKPFTAPEDRQGFSPPSSRASTPRKVDEPQPSPTKEQREEPRINTPRSVQPARAAATPRAIANWKLPDVRTLLSSGSEQDFDRDSLVRQARIIEETLQSFGAPGRVVEINTGPVITQYGVEPDYLTGRNGKKSRVKVSAIAQLDKDLQLALGAKSIRVEAPVPGKGYVGIEVPNDKAALVSLRDVMEADSFHKYDSPLAIALGQSVDGAPIAADLRQMPHLLIAGTTGSGKSVCVNSIIGSILARNTPDMVKFIMVDPKRVELTGYNGIPHLVAPVVVELERIVGVLKWVTREMDERYKKFSNAGARNIEDYNQHLDPSMERMPYIVVIIDELADLMMLAPDETERVITRIAALARATGIHLVIATQRPSVDVVTGLIKANFPARIAFAVAGGVDSRVILDQPGAERLLGRGDMLYMSPDSPAPQRLQGVFVSDMEINNITRFWKSQSVGQTQQKPITALVMDDEDAPKSRSVIPRGERFMQSPPPSTQSQSAFWDDPDDDDDDILNKGTDHEDELYEEAVEMVRRLNKASVSLLQRRLRIGYTRAARLIDTMEADGIIGPPVEGSKPRKVLPPKTT